jgi:hypothetical protein
MGRLLSSRVEQIRTIDVLHRLRAAIPTGNLIVLWDGASYHRVKTA